MELLKELIAVLTTTEAILLLFVLNLVGLGLKYMKLFPNKYIPAVCFVAGAIIFYFIGQTGLIRPTQRYPGFILALYGCVIGALAWLLHNRLLYKLEPYLEKFLPFPKEPENKG